MLKNLMILPDGTQLSSGGEGGAILCLTLTQSVNSKEELTLGSACAAMLEAKLLLPAGVQIRVGDELVLCKVDPQGNRHQVGIFVADQPVRTGAYSVKLTAFDRMVYMDRDITQWLGGLTGWPYTLQELAQMVCRECGVELVEEPLPNGGHPVAKFAAADVTGRELLQWIGEAAGRFCHADPEGRLRFDWYTPAGRLSLGPSFLPGISDSWQYGELTLQLEGLLIGDGKVSLEGNKLTVTDDGAGRLTLIGPDRQFYFAGSLQKSDYTVAPVQRVQIRSSSQDVGTVYPDREGAANTYIITANPLLTAQNAQSLTEVAKSIYTLLQDVCYTPCKVRLPSEIELQPGQILQVTDSNGATFDMYIMQKQQSGQRDTLECTGSQIRSSTTAVNNRYLKALSGKVLEIQTDVDGLKVKNADTDGRTAQLALDLEGLQGRVTLQENGMQQMTQLQQDARSLELKVQKILEESGQVVTSTGYSFTDEGLRIAKSGQEIESLVDHTGLYVRRAGQLILQAGSQGVSAVDVSVGNYLVVGSHARFEDYEGGTGCFYI